MRYIGEQAPNAKITYDEGTDPAQAAKVAAGAQIAIVFVTQWMTEGQDNKTLSLPDKQDDLVAAVAKANPQTIVVLENGGPVNMPWAEKTKAIMESWYPGIGGGQAIANILFGKVNPSGKLPVTFAATEADLPHPAVTGLVDRPAAPAARPAGAAGAAAAPRQRPPSFSVDYNVEGMAVGYRWFQVKQETPQFAFGYGLSYTKFAYSNLKVDADAKSVTFDVRNTGLRAGDEIAEVYVTLPDAAGEPFRKLAGFKRVSIKAGAVEKVEVPIDPLYLSVYSTDTDSWSRLDGKYVVEVGGSSGSLPLHETFSKGSGTLAPR
jgi:beta-glucosidase